MKIGRLVSKGCTLLSRVLIENSQVENHPLDVSMEDGLGSEELVLRVFFFPHGNLVLVDTRHPVRGAP